MARVGTRGWRGARAEAAVRCQLSARHCASLCVTECRQVRRRLRSGAYDIVRMDEFVDELLTTEMVREMQRDAARCHKMPHRRTAHHRTAAPLRALVSPPDQMYGSCQSLRDAVGDALGDALGNTLGDTLGGALGGGLVAPICSGRAGVRRIYITGVRHRSAALAQAYRARGGPP